MKIVLRILNQKLKKKLKNHVIFSYEKSDKKIKI